MVQGNASSMTGLALTRLQWCGVVSGLASIGTVPFVFGIDHLRQTLPAWAISSLGMTLTFLLLGAFLLALIHLIKTAGISKAKKVMWACVRAVGGASAPSARRLFGRGTRQG
jgi:hypothetical protein